jgi:hypothetical protein
VSRPTVLLLPLVTSLLAAASCTSAADRVALGASPTAAPAPSPLETLTALGARVRPWTPRGQVRPAAARCSVADGVVLLRGPTGARYSKPLLLNGAFAVKFARFEALAQEEAQRVFGRRLVGIDHLGTYVCRTIAGRAGSLSEHALGNAIDVSAFVLRGGRRVVVSRDFARIGVAPATPAAQFLAALIERARREGLFGTILTPDFDAHHANHLHLDGRQWGSWWRTFVG